MKTPFGGVDILAQVQLAEIADPAVGSDAYDCAFQRDRSTRSITAMPWLPQLPDSWAQELYDRIEAQERSLAAPNLLDAEYTEGTAIYPDEIARVTSSNTPGYLFTAEHATRPISVKTGKKRFPDAGTAGLAAVLAEEHGTAFIMRGKQTTNVPSVAEHPIKDLLATELAGSAGFLSVHGKAGGMFVRPTDRAEVHACIGLGIAPDEAVRELARQVVLAARDDLGLYAVISNDQECYIQQPNSTDLKRNEDGSIKRSRLAALTPTMTTNYSRQFLAAAGRRVPSMQIEITNLLRLTQADLYPKDRKSLVMGVALGYKLLEKIVDLTPGIYPQILAEEVVE